MVMKSELKSPNTRPNLPRISSSESGFFFCGIRLEPLVTPSPSSSQPNSSLEYKIQSSDRRLRCNIVVDAAYRKSKSKSRPPETSILLFVIHPKPNSRATASRQHGQPR